MVSSAADGTVRVWCLLDDETGAAERHCFHNHSGEVRGLAVSATHVVSGGDDGLVRVRDLATGGASHTCTARSQPRARFTHYVQGLSARS